jgi:hypothetical protein
MAGRITAPEGDMQGDAVPGDDKPESQSSGPVRSDADQASKRTS